METPAMKLNEALENLQLHDYPDDRLAQLGHHLTVMLKAGGPLSDILTEADRVLEEDDTQAVEIVVHFNDSDLQGNRTDKSTVIDLKRVPEPSEQERHQDKGSAQTSSSSQALRKRNIKIRLEKEPGMRHRKDSGHFEDQARLTGHDAGQPGSAAAANNSRLETHEEMWREFMASHRRLMDEKHRLRRENARLIADYNRRSAEFAANRN